MEPITAILMTMEEQFIGKYHKKMINQKNILERKH